MAASQPNPARKWEEDKDEEGERPGWWERAARKVREEEEAEQKKKKEEEEQAKRKERRRMKMEALDRERWAKFDRLTRESIQKKAREEAWRKSLALHEAKIERENRQFNEKVLREARRAREKEEEEEEDERKRKGKAPTATQ